MVIHNTTISVNNDSPHHFVLVLFSAVYKSSHYTAELRRPPILNAQHLYLVRISEVSI